MFGIAGVGEVRSFCASFVSSSSLGWTQGGIAAARCGSGWVSAARAEEMRDSLCAISGIVALCALCAGV